ncbi:MAG: cob(I)yrinic acid a,c-diamide adenosyltransferase [Alphaproteobacteria bacterium]|nr:cob(I)yrinic acid a,c-diamide adenosyltransferase [Alphaproteobacteria bacterium]
MVSLTKIYTRGGDKGETSLVGGARVAKHSMRMEAIGTIDECNAAIGLVRHHTLEEADDMLARIQHDLFDLGADLATPIAKTSKNTQQDLRIIAKQVTRLEREIDAINVDLKPLSSFVLPGGSGASGYLHLARAITRRAERHICALAEAEDVNPHALQYINRLSDHLFVMARQLNDNGINDVLWEPGDNR